MAGGRDVPVVRHQAGLPQPGDRGAPARPLAHLRIAQHQFQDALVLGDRRARQAGLARDLVEAVAQALDRGEIEMGVAPLQHLHPLEGVAFQRLDEVVLQRWAAAGRAEGAVAVGAAGPAGDLGELDRVQPAELVAVELAVGGEGDVLDIEVEAHADGVGRDQVVDVTRLVNLHLRVAGARRQRSQHDGGAAALAADELGDGIDLVGREGDDGRAPRQAGDLLFAGEQEVGEARAGDDVGARNELLDEAAHGARAEQHGLVAAPAVEDAIGEDVTALEIGGDLDLVDGEEGDVDVEWHGLDGRHPVARARRLDLLLAGDQGYRPHAGAGDELAIDLAGEEPQRQADQAGGMGQHPLDGERRLARVGGPEDCGDPSPAEGGGQWRKRQGHSGPSVSCRHANGVTFRYRPWRRSRGERVWNESGPNR